MQVDGKTFSMTRGDSEGITVRMMDRKTKEPVPFMPGDTLYFTAKDSDHAGDHKYVLQIIVTEFEPDGSGRIEFKPSDTKHLYFRRYPCDIQVTFADGTVKTIVKNGILDIGVEHTDD